MNKTLIRSGVGLAALVLVVGGFSVHQAQAAGNRYAFVARGVITDIDEANKTIKMDVTKVNNAKAKEDLEGQNIQFTDGSAKVFRVVNKKDVRGTYHNFAIGQEVGIHGFAKNDDTFDITFARIEDRSFSVVGLLEALDQNAQTLQVLVTSSTYKPTVYKKGTTIDMTYTDAMTFKNSNGKEEITADSVNADAQKVKVTGTITGTNTWQAKILWDGYKANK